MKMIVTKLDELLHQSAEHPSLFKAVEFLQGIQGQELEDGRIEIDGKQVYALVQSYQGKTEIRQPRFEAHRRYIDVQYLAAGKELFGWAPLEKMAETDTYNEEKDVVHGNVPEEVFTLVRLSPGMLAVVYPEDAHAPGLADGEPAPVKKIVVKVAIA
jgi:YhcH/YjgK/YiaL family protein